MEIFSDNLHLDYITVSKLPDDLGEFLWLFIVDTVSYNELSRCKKRMGIFAVG